jgi:hypothetical protein
MRLLIAATCATIALASGPFIIAPLAAQSASGSVAKDGSCPTGFKQSGSNCISDDKVALPKLGSCPTGFKASAHYCVGDEGDYAEIRSGSCPSGLKTSGRYCVRS